MSGNKAIRVVGAAIAVSAAGLLVVQAGAAETKLTTVTGLLPTNAMTMSYRTNFVDPINARGKGTVQIKYLGAHSVVPPRKAAKAVERGQFDMLHSPTSYYIGTVPEGYALLAANQTTQQIRNNGGWELLEEVYRKKAGAQLIAWGEWGTQYNTYLVFKPKLDANGVPNLSGIKMRATGTYRPLFKALGASTINMKSSEIYTGLQRGVVQGFGWPNVAIVQLGLHKIVKYRVTPSFYHTNTVVTMNVDKWNSLSRAAKDLIKQVGIEYEASSIVYLEKLRASEEKVIHAAGVKDISLTGAAAKKYLDIAHGAIWKELAARSEYADRLRAKLYVR